MIEIEDHGSFARFAQDCRNAAARLQPELNDSFADSLTRLREDVRRSAGSILPRRGGLAGLVAGMTFVVSRKSTGAQLTARSKYNLGSIDGGTVAHPVYGHRVFVRQHVTRGFWSNVVEQSEPRIADDAEKAMDRVIKEVG